MKGKIKKLFSLVLCLVVFSAFTITAFADTATSVVAGPSMKLLRWTKGSTYSLTPGGGNPQGSKCYVFFSGYGSLPSSFAKDNDRALEVFLMEDDFWSDTTVKYYGGTFTGWTLSSMYLSSTVTAGEIESDATAEMYIDAKVYGTHNSSLRDPAEGTDAGKLFNYQIGINS